MIGERDEILRVAVSGPLHGRILGVPDGAQWVYAVGEPLSVSLVHCGLGPLPPVYYGADAITLYVVVDRGPRRATRLLLEHSFANMPCSAGRLPFGEFKGATPSEVVFDALAIAAGVRREQVPVKINEAALRESSEVRVSEGLPDAVGGFLGDEPGLIGWARAVQGATPAPVPESHRCEWACPATSCRYEIHSIRRPVEVPALAEMADRHWRTNHDGPRPAGAAGDLCGAGRVAPGRAAISERLRRENEKLTSPDHATGITVIGRPIRDNPQA